MNKKRWYDKHKDSEKALELLNSLHPTIRKKLCDDIINVASAIKTVHRENDTAPLSIGLERVLGLYQTNKGRRWYDKNPELSVAIKTISTLPENDYLNIMEGICMSLK
jgi:hypothetical protein